MASTVLDTLVVAVKGDTRGLTQDLAKSQTDLTALQAGGTKVARTLAGAFEQFALTGKLSFESLKTIALRALDDIAKRAITAGLSQIFGGSDGAGSIFGTVLSAIGLSGRAAGGAVTAGQPYIVGERGPELFIPQGAGTIASNGSANSRTTQITVNIAASAADPRIMARSAAQIAASVRRSLDQAGPFA